MNSIYEQIKKIDGVELKLQTSLEKFTTIRLSAVGDIATVTSVLALQQLLPLLINNRYKYNIVGWGANQVLIHTSDVLFIRLQLENSRDLLKYVRDEYILSASTPLNIMTSAAKKLGLKGWEVFTGVPASLGGAICMNAGTGLGEIGDLIKWVKVVTATGDLKIIEMDEKSFVYRNNCFLNKGDVIIEACVIHHGIDENLKLKIDEYLDYRKQTQPVALKNCGCVFKNYSPAHRAGHFVDLLGLKELSYKGLQVSSQHGNFINNLDFAKSDDFIELIGIIQDELELHTGIKFEFEVKIY